MMTEKFNSKWERQINCMKCFHIIIKTDRKRYEEKKMEKKNRKKVGKRLKIVGVVKRGTS